MRIGLISDTHIPEAGRDLWPQVYDAFLGINPAGPKVDLILHAGDGRSPAPDTDARLKPRQVLEVDGLRIGLTHDLPLPEWPPYRTLEMMMDRCFGGPVHVVLHRHTHLPPL